LPMIFFNSSDIVILLVSPVTPPGHGGPTGSPSYPGSPAPIERSG